MVCQDIYEPRLRSRPGGKLRCSVPASELGAWACHKRSVRCQKVPSLLSDIGECPLAWSHFTKRPRRWQELPEPAEADDSGLVRQGGSSPGAGAYLVACGWTPTTVPEPSRPGSAAAAPGTASKFLAAITTELQARGLAVRQSQRQGILAEISASSPAQPDRGSVSIGYDGFMVWERWAPATHSDRAAGIVRLIAWILMGDAVAAAVSAR